MWLCNHVLMVCEQHNRDTRLSNSMNVVHVVPRPNHEVQYDGSVIWNELPEHIKEASILENLKNMYKRHYYKR